MTEMGGEVDAGRLYMDAYVDTAGLTRGLQKRIDAEMRSIRAKIKAEIDTSAIVGQARQAAMQASRAAKVQFQTSYDTGSIVAQSQAAAREASKAATVAFKASFDSGDVAAQARQAAERASQSAKVDVQASIDQGSIANAQRQIESIGDTTVNADVKADTGRATADIAALRAREQATPVNLPVVGDASVFENAMSAAGDALAKFSAIPAIIGGVYTLGAAVGQLAGGLVSMASAASSAVSVLAVIPSLASAAVQGIGSMIVGFSGIGDAVGALSKQQNAVTQDTTRAAEAQVSAARRIADARQALGEAVHRQADEEKASGRAIAAARQSVSDALAQQAEDARSSAQAIRAARRAVSDALERQALDARAAAQSIADARRAVADAQEDEREALTDLNDARAEAIEYIQDLRRELRASRAEELGAANDLQTAKERLADVGFDAAATAQERRDAEQAVRDAQADLEAARDRRADLTRENAKADKAGVEGTDIMIAARERAEAATEREADAERSLAAARESAARQATANARAVADARAQVAEAARAADMRAIQNAKAVQAARQGVAQAQHAADDRARASAQAVAQAQRALRDAQVGVTTAATAQSAAQMGVANAFQHLSPAGERFARFLYGLAPRMREFRNAVQTALLPPIQRGITAALPLLDTLQEGMVDTAGIVGNLGLRVGRLFGSDTFRSDVAGIMYNNNIAIGAFSDTLYNLIRILTNVATAAGPTLLVPFAIWLRTLSQAGVKATDAGVRTGKMAAFFIRARDAAALLKDIVANLAGAIFGVGKAAQSSGRGLLTSLNNAAARWNTWANGDAGQKRMREFFDAVKPVTAAVGELAGSLAAIFVQLSESGASPVMGFLNTLNFLADALERAASVPGLGVVIAWIASIAGGAGALGLVAGYLIRFGGLIGTLTRLLGLNAAATWLWTTAMNAGRAAALGTRIQLAALAVWTAAVAAAQRVAAAAQAAWTGAVWLFNAAWAANPIGLAIVALLAIGAALVWAYKKFDWFREGVDAVWRFLVKGAEWLWDKLFGHSIFPDMLAAFRRIFGLIGKVVRAFWNKVVKPTFRSVGKAVGVLGDTFKWLWRKVVKPVWGYIEKAVQAAWRYYYKPILKAIWNALQTLGGWFKWLWDKGVRPAWESIRKLVRSTWRNWISPAFTNMRKGVKAVKEAFENAKTGIARAWSTLREALRKPIRASLSLLNTWVIDKFNWLSKKFGGPEVKRIDTARLAEGGPVPGYSPNSRADNIPILATAREFMVKRRSADKLRRENPGALEFINNFGRLPGNVHGEAMYGGRVQARFADGGTIGRIGGFVSHAIRKGVQRLAAGGSVWPTVGRRTSTYGGHDGVDINQPPGPDYGAPIFAWRSGRVTYVGSGRGYGVPAIFQKAPGYPEVVYGHSQRAIVRAGQQVSAGQVLGYVGNTGNSSGAHLHFGVPGGSYEQAMSLLRGAGAAKGSAGDQGLIGKAMSWLGSLGGKIRGALAKPLDYLKGVLSGPVRRFKDQFNHPFGQMLAGIPGKLAASAASFVSKGVDKKEAAYVPPAPTGLSTPGGSSGLGGPAARRAAAAVRAAFNFGGTIGGVRNDPGSKHHIGKALDIMTYANVGLGNRIAAFFLRNRGKYGVDNLIWQQRITNAGRGWQWGGMEDRGSPTANHRDHVHVDFYDKGGPLYPGSTLAVNTSGKTETVFTNDNMVALARDLKAAAATLRHTVTDRSAGPDGPVPLFGNLSITGRPEDVRDMFQDAVHEMKVIRQGGVHAKRAP